MGGFFSLGKKAPSYPMVTAPKVMTGADAYSGAMNWGNKNFGNAMQARESALSDLNNKDYYSSFQPTSFEQALADQSFKNVWPDQQNYMANVLSKSGMAYSPVAASTLGKAYGDTTFNIGQYLANQGNQRAQYSLASRLGIDPMSIMNPYANAGMNQSNEQAGYDWQATKQNADAQYANAMQKYMRNQALLPIISKVSPLGGFLAGGGEGAAMWISNLMGGSSGGGYGNSGYGSGGQQSQPVNSGNKTFGGMLSSLLINPSLLAAL